MPSSYANIDDFIASLRAWRVNGGPYTLREWTARVETPAINGSPDITPRDRAILFALAWGLFELPEGPCPYCRSERYLVPESNQAQRPLRVLVRCSSSCSPKGRSVLHNTIFENMPLHTFFPAIMLYARRYPQHVLESELHVHSNTLRGWRVWLQDVMGWELHNAPSHHISSFMVGGLDIVVEIDESLMARSKPQAMPFARAAAMDRRRLGIVRRWAWGAVERVGRAAGGQAAVVLLDADVDHPRGRQALVNALLQCVRPGSRIIHDDWGAYRAIDWSTLPFQHDARSIVNHSKEIKNMFGEHTNHIECVWSSLKAWLREHCGGQLCRSQSLLAGYITEFCWRQHLGASMAGDSHVVEQVFELIREHQTALAAPLDVETDSD